MRSCSCTAMANLCMAIRPEHGQQDTSSGHIGQALENVNGRLPIALQVGRLSADAQIRQGDLLTKLEKAAFDATAHAASPAKRTSLNAYSAPTSAKWHGVVPSRTLDKDLDSCTFATLAALQLGVDVQEETCSCPFCGAVCDLCGVHALSCMAGGDTTTLHNEVRDEVFSWCRRGLLNPKLEKGGLLSQVSLPGGQRRPADVLVCHRAGFLSGLPGGDSATRRGKVALDIAVINALGQGHGNDTLAKPLQAAIAYSATKAVHLNTRAQCEQAGLSFEPMVFEAQGGVEPRAAAILHKISEAVTAAESAEASRIKSEMLQRLAIIIARGSARAVLRRRAQRSSTSLRTAAAQELARATLEEAAS